MAHKGFLLRAILVLTSVIYSQAEPKSKIAFTGEEADTPVGAYLDALEQKLTAFSSRVPDAVAGLQHAAPEPLEADSLFLEFRRYYFHLADSLGYHGGPGLSTDRGMFWNQPVQKALKNPATYQQVHQLVVAHGFDLVRHEGEYTIKGSETFLDTTFTRYLSPGSRAYMALRAAEGARQFSDDASMKISWDELADRIAAWEQLLDTYDRFALREGAEAWYRIYRKTYFTGMDNTRIYDYKTKELKAEVRSSYERSIERFEHLKWTLLLRDYLAVLERNQYRRGPEVDEFLRANEIGSMLGVEPPLR